MISFASSGTELTRFKKGKLPKLALVVLLFIPLIYGALYLWAFWAPTEEMKNLPVALVNDDRGASLSDGQAVHAGDDVVKELLDGKDLDWKKVDAETARTGVADGTYYFSVSLPQNFSEDAVSVDSDNPAQAQIQVEFNDANNFLASTLGQSAMTLVRNAVAEKISATTADTMLVGVNKLGDGIRTAADGAGELNDGVGTLADGAGELVLGLGALADGSDQLAAGAGTLAGGVNTLSGGAGQLAAGAGTLAGGADTLAAGNKTLAAGMSQAATGAGTLAGGAQDLAAGLGQLAQNTVPLRDGAANLQSQTTNLPAQAERLNSGAAALNTGVGTLHQNAVATQNLATTIQGILADPNNKDLTVAQLNELLAQGPATMTGLVGATGGLAAATAADSALGSGAASLAAGTGQLNGSVPALVVGINQLAAGTGGVNDAVQKLNAGAGTLSAGAGTLSASLNNAVPGATQLADGAATLSGGAGTLAGKTRELASGAQTLNAGAGTLSEKTRELAAGADTAASGGDTLLEGTQKLADGSGELATKLAEGAEEAPSYDAQRIDKMTEVVANPIGLSETNENKASSFGEGFAPFFIALAAFVGALITWLILRALPTRALASRTSGMRSVLTGFVPAALIGAGQVAIMMVVLVYAIGLRPDNWIGTALFMYLTTLAFLSLQQMFIILFGSATGRVISLVLLMLQLSSSGGTYPVQTTPGFFQIMHPFMPATYVVNGLRQLITGGVDERFWIALAYMVGLLVITFAVSAIAAGKQKVWTMKRLRPELAI